LLLDRFADVDAYDTHCEPSAAVILIARLPPVRIRRLLLVYIHGLLLLLRFADVHAYALEVIRITTAHAMSANSARRPI
jgi:hypothetical protein